MSKNTQNKDAGASNSTNNSHSAHNNNVVGQLYAEVNSSGSFTIIDRLFSSFTELETAIASAKNTLRAKDNVPEEVFERLGSYDGILAKQRLMAKSLCEHIQSGNWDEVSRHVSIINGLSGLIRDDARAILSSLALNSDRSSEDETKHFC